MQLFKLYFAFFIFSLFFIPLPKSISHNNKAFWKMNQKNTPLPIFSGQISKKKENEPFFYKKTSIDRENRKTIHLLRSALHLGFFCFLLSSCGKNETETLPDLAMDYFPLQIGKALIYDIDTIQFDPQPNAPVKIDTFRWQVKETFVDTFRDITGQLNYKVERSERPRGSAGSFEVRKIFTSALTTNEALRTEDNLKFVKMPRFLNEKTTWDGNVYCDQSLIIEVAGERIGLFSKKWNYEVLTIGKPEKVGTKDFTDVITIRAQSDTRILTEKRYNLEKYAKGVGLVYKEQHILDTQKLDASIAWEKKAEKGFIVKQTLVN